MEEQGAVTRTVSAAGIMTEEGRVTEPFSLSNPFVVEFQSGGIRTVRCRYPSDPECTALAGQTEYRRRILPGRKSKVETVLPTMAELSLLLKVMEGHENENPGDYDEFDAQWVFSLLSRGDHVSTTAVDNATEFVIVLNVFGNRDVSIRLKSPRRRDVFQYRERVMNVTSEENAQVTQVNLGVAGQFFDRLFVSAEGYEGKIPVWHKDHALYALIRALSPE